MHYILDTANLWGQRYLADTQHPSGWWAGPTSSRMYETALVVLALRSFVRDHPLLTAGRIWLQDNNPQPEPHAATLLEALYKQAALGEQPTLSLEDRDFYDDLGLLRPTLLLLVLGHALGCAVQSPMTLRAITAELRAITAQRERLDLPPATICEYLAIYILAATLTQGAAAVGEEVAALQAMQSEDGSFFGRAGPTAAAALALRYAAQDRAALSSVLVALTALQHRDGGWGATALPLIDTGRSLTVARGGSIEMIERSLAWLTAQQTADGAWVEPGVAAAWTTGVVLRGLSPFREQPDAAQLALPAVNWLVAQRRDDGIWELGGLEPTLDRVAEIVQALRFWLPPGRKLLTKADQWLLRHQQHDGLWSAPWTINNLVTTATVVAALGPASVAVQRAAQVVVDQQQSDGCWGRTPEHAPSPLATAAALEILITAEFHDARAIRRGLDWLVMQQQGGGAWRGSLELCAPAPLRHNNTAFVHAACMRAIILGRSWQQAVDLLG